MTTSAVDVGTKAAVPPEERFWKRYSPHGEAALSLAGSAALHALAVGALALFALYLAALLFKPARSLPVEPVRLGEGGPAGPGNGGPPAGLVEDPGGGPGKEQDPGRDAEKRLELARPEVKPPDRKFEGPTRPVEVSSDPVGNLRKLKEMVGRKTGGEPGAGPGGKPGGGGPGGPGKGPGGKVPLTKQEKRMLRWHMHFTANSGPEYLAQLRGLGAILVIPLRDGPNPPYKVVRDPRPGARLLDEDVGKIRGIYWIDDNPKSVTDVMATLGVSLRPAKFVAFLPEKLEAELYALERRHAEDVLGVRPFDEDRIDETHFKVVPAPGGGYKPELMSVTLKR